MDFKTSFEKSWQVFVTFPAPILVNTLLAAAVSIITLGIMAPVVSAGYMQSLLLALREKRKPEARDLFAHMNLFFPLLVFGILFMLAVTLGFALLVLPGIVVVLAAAFFLLYMLPLMTDEGLGLVEAVKESTRMALEDPVSEHLAVVAVYVVLGSIGSSTGIGSLFTQPYSCLIVLCAYEEKRKRLLPGGGIRTSLEEERSAPPPPPPGS
jgi:hypothetical protein